MREELNLRRSYTAPTTCIGRIGLKIIIPLKPFSLKPTGSEGLHNAQYSDDDRELSRDSLYD